MGAFASSGRCAVPLDRPRSPLSLSSGRDVVLVDDAADNVTPTDGAAGGGRWWRGDRLGKFEGPVRPRLVVVVEVLGDDGFEVTSGEDE